MKVAEIYLLLAFNQTASRPTYFFGTYLDALAQAVKERVTSNPELIETIDRLYETMIQEDVL